MACDENSLRWAHIQASSLFNMPTDIANIICQYDNELLYKIFKTESKEVLKEVSKLYKKIGPILQKIDSLKSRNKYLLNCSIKFCPHVNKKSEREWDGHRGWTYTYCKLCGSNLR